MATPIVMPQMGYDMREGTVVRWLKGEGDNVNRGEVIAEIETDKATIEMQAYVAGVIGRIVVETGRTVPVGELIAVIADPGEELPSLETLAAQAPPPEATEAPPQAPAQEAQPKPEAQPAPAQATAVAEPPAPAPATEAPPRAVRASPIARRLAREQGIDLATVQGTGPGGRIVEADILAYQNGAPAEAPATTAPAAPAPAPPSTEPAAEQAPLSRMRQAIARVTAQSKREIPHFYVTADIDMSAAMGLRRQVNEALGDQGRVSVNDMLVKACALALQTYPKFNASFRDDHLEMHSSINIGIAIALEEGLIIASVPGCQSRSLADITRGSRDLIGRAEKGTLHPDEYASTFSISNMGMFDVDSFAAIIYPPNAAVLAVGTVKEQPVVRDGQVAVAQMMKATVAVDHRVADGAEAARFMVEVKRLLEHPLSLLV